ncbi:MAG TPA: hypothetical protein VJB60_04335 [Candidatus Peribacterales bacterium]|nr:hypothetical protein [Candidatus Peribacterales bacterium]
MPLPLLLHRHSHLLTRRHRFVTLALAVMAAGMFLIFITRGFLIGGSLERFRTCSASPIFKDLSFHDVTARYHFTMQELTEERMRLYEGSTPLQCDAESMDDVIPTGALAREVARSLPDVPDWPAFSYRNFELLLHEFWRTYDCHLSSYNLDANAYAKAQGIHLSEEAIVSNITREREFVLERERARARATFDRLMNVLRASEKNLPVHAALRCLQRGAADVRNALSLVSDAAQCLPARLGQPETSLRQ